MRILGIDPGLATVGYGVIDVYGNRMHAVDYGSILTPAGMATHKRLNEIYRALEELIKKYQPDDMAIEELFWNTNQTTGIRVSEARGVILLSGERNSLNIFEYTPLQIKQSVVGYGRADKHQVIEMTTMFLGLKEAPKPDDTADALAAAICHAHTGTSRLADFYNQPTSMAGKIGMSGKGSRGGRETSGAARLQAILNAEKNKKKLNQK